MIITERPIASDYSFEVLQRRRLVADLGPCVLDSTNQRLWHVPSQVVQREAYFASREPDEESRS